MASVTSGSSPTGLSILQPASGLVGNTSQPASILNAISKAPTTTSTPAAPANPTNTTAAASSTASSYDPNTVAYYGDLINQLTTELNGAEGEEGTVANNITNGYNTAVDEENQSRNTAAAQNGEARESNIGSINSNANSSYSALEQLLGRAGAGVSSAATTNVPYAVSQNASTQRAGADTTYNTNNTNIQQTYENALNDLLTQKDTNLANGLSGLKEQEQSDQSDITNARIDQSQYEGQSFAAAEKAAAGDQASANNIQSALNSIFSQYATPSYTPPAAPALNSYSVDPTSINAASTNPSTDSSFLPYLQQATQSNILTGSNTQPASTAASAGAA